MAKKSSIIKLIQLWGTIVLLSIGGSIITFDIVASYRDFNSRADQMRTDYMTRQKQMIKQEVNLVVRMINHKREQSEAITRSKIKLRCYEAYSIVENIYQQNKTAHSEDGIQQILVDALRPIRFEGGRGYYFVSSMDGTMILHPFRSELEGKKQFKTQDSRGNYIANDLIEIVKQSGEGFYEYYWTKPNFTETDFKKISFVKQFEPYNWFIGTGLYVDDVEQQIQNDILGEIAAIRFGDNENGYIFVVTYDGTTLMNDTQKHLIGKNIWELTDPDGVKVIQEERKVVENPEGDFIYYSWNKPSTKQISLKVSFVRGIDEWEWMVGAGLYLDDVEADICIIQAKLNQKIKATTLYSIFITLGIISIFLFLFSILSRKLKNDINLFSSFFSQATVSDELIDRDIMQFDELDRMAENANIMITKRKMAETALQESEERYRGIFNNSITAVYVFDKEKNFIDSNQAGLDLLGYSRKELLNMTIADVDADPDAVIPVHNQLLGGGGISNYEHQLLSKDGKIITVLNNSNPMTGVDGSVNGIQSTLIDITDFKQLEKQLQQAQKMEAIGLLAGGVAHDLNNILSGLTGYPELLLLKLSEDSDLRQPIEAIKESGERAAAVVADLLTVARGVASTRVAANLNVLVAEYLASPEWYHLHSLHPYIQCNRILAENLPNISCSAVHIKKCIMNLVINAAESIEKSGSIMISTTAVSPDSQWAKENGLQQNEYVILAVTDTGTGISKEDIEHIFEPFYTKKVMGKSGTGLGLAVVWNTIEDHDGKIFVESSEEGTCFQLYFPVNNEKSSDQVVNNTKEKHTGNNEHILVVDDELQLCDIACQMLQVSGYKVDSVSSGELAVKYLEENSVDLIVMDMLMEPGMNGYQTYKEILKLHPDQKALIVSGFSEGDDVKAALKIGADGFIKKPYSMAQLAQAVYAALMDS